MGAVDERVEFSRVINVEDVDGDTLAVTGVGDLGWLEVSSTTNNGDNSATVTISGTPQYTDVGSFEFDLEIDDDAGALVTKTFTIIVNDVANLAPVGIRGPNTDIDEDSGVVSFTISGSDVDGTVDEFRIHELPARGSVYVDSGLTDLLEVNSTIAADINEQAILYYVPESNDFGTRRLYFFAIDNNNSEASSAEQQRINITAVNDAPVANSDDSAGGNEDGGPFHITLSGSDPDDGDAVKEFIIKNVASLNGNLFADVGLTSELHVDDTVAASLNQATVYFKPAADFFGEALFDFAAIDQSEDAEGDAATIKVTLVSINDAPVAVDDDFTTPHDTVISGNVMTNDSDVDTVPGSLNATRVSDVTNGTLTLNADGSFTYDPDTGYSGSDQFTYQLDDGALDSNVATVTITVNIAVANTAPVADPVTISGDEDGSPFSITLTGTDADAGDSVKEFIIKDISGLNGEIFDPNNPGTALAVGNKITAATDAAGISFEPTADFNGTTSFSFAAIDASEDEEGASADVTISLAPVGDNPVFAVTGDLGTVTAGTAFSQDIIVEDVDGDTLTIAAAGDLGWLTLSGTTDNGDNTFTATLSGTPTGSDVGTLDFTIRVTGSGVLPLDQNFSVTVNGANEAPVANGTAVSTDEDTQLTSMTVLTSDAETDPASLTPTVVSDVSHGNLTLYGDGTFTYTPNDDFNGSDQFTYKVSDGEAESNEATVDITIDAVNDAPVAVNDTFGTAEDVAILSDVLTNDTDVDTDPASLTAVLVSNVSNGNLTLGSNGSFTYTPDSGFFGSDQFSYRLNDGVDDSNVATVVLTISEGSGASGANNPPVADNVTATGNEGAASIAITLTGSDDDTGDFVKEFKITSVASLNGQIFPTSGLATQLAANDTLSASNDSATVYFVPDANFKGSTFFNFAAIDNEES
ncbi:MAG: Ig-like domain-containing protein [Rhizobiaceae bacterium]